ncbi:hypothetical protein NBRC116584_21310 [Hydrogenophaga sp. 5NK40-0174]
MVEAPQRFDYWVGAICECFLEMEADTTDRPGFEGRLQSTPLGDLRINRVSGSNQRVYRTPGAIARSHEDFYFLLCKEARSSAVITQHGAGTARLLPGDLTLIDSRRRYELHFPDEVDVFSLALPTAWLDTWLPDASCQLGRRIDGSEGWGHVLSAYVRKLGDGVGALPDSVQVDHLGGLLALTLGAGAANQNARVGDDAAREAGAQRSLRERIDLCLHERFAEPGLTAGDVAASLGVSVRSLHRALASEERTFASELMAQRLRSAQRMLQSRSFDGLTTAEVGRRVGLLDASHFTRAYRRWSGVTPARARDAR